MAANFVDIKQLTSLKVQVANVRDSIAKNMQSSNDALSEMVSILGGTTSVSKSIGRFQSATTDEQKNIVEQLEKMEAFLDSKIQSYSTIYSDASSQISSSAERSLV